MFSAIKLQRKSRLKVLFNMTQEEYEAIAKYQGNTCGICKQPPKTYALSVDHDHKTGLVRGLLCHRHNHGIGLFRDDPDLLQAAVDFLRDPPASKALGSPKYGSKGRVKNKAATRRRLNGVT